MAKGE
jgi:hypothetical protein